MVRFSRNLLLATCLVFGGAASAFAQMDGMGEHDGPPPMLVIMPPPDVEKPEGIEMSEDPAEAFRQMFDVFFDMMDEDGNGELNHDELGGWVHPPRHMDGGPGGGMEGPPMGGEMEETIRHLEEELRMVRQEQHMRHQEQHMRHIEELGHHRDRIMEDIGHMREEQAHLAERLREMDEEARRVAEELQQAQSEPPMGDEPPMD
ncbi:MAG: hypothetical protein VCF24_19585 [Candidatus Latescibacterota bacterium]